MRDWDLTAIFHFLNHPRMYLGNSDNAVEERVDTFLIAYEMGSKLECRFRAMLMEHLFRKYSVYPSPAGLMHQVKSIAENKSVDWFELFAAEGKEVLREVSDGDGKNRFAKILRKKIADLLSKGPDPSTYDWGFVNWNHVADHVKKWPGVNLNPDEMELFLKISDAWLKCLKPGVNEVPETLKKDMALLKELVEKNLSLS